jgi:broad specificity phosphatase PhoE
VIRRLLLVRHGVTTWNREGRFQGHLDTRLDPLGEVEARAVAARIVRETPGVVVVASSPLQRALATARILADALAVDGRRVEVQLEPGLMEIGQGEWQGRTHAELASEEPERYATWAKSGGFREPPGGEPVPAAAARASDAVQRLLTAADPGTAGTLCCVSHGGILRLVAGRLVGMSDEAAWTMHLDNAALSVLTRESGGGGWRIDSWNDKAHLAPQLTAADHAAEGTPPAL